MKGNVIQNCQFLAEVPTIIDTLSYSILRLSQNTPHGIRLQTKYRFDVSLIKVPHDQLWVDTQTTRYTNSSVVTRTCGWRRLAIRIPASGGFIRGVTSHVDLRPNSRAPTCI